MTAFPLAAGEPVDFAIADQSNPSDDFYFSTPDFGGGTFDVILIGSDFLIAPGALQTNVPVNAAASGFVVQTATGHVDTCGVDLTVPEGVSCPGTSELTPNFVVVRQDDGLFARYYHLKNDGPPVKPGDRVSCGQFLGHVGSSGVSATPHLHFELDALTSAQMGLVVNDIDGLINGLTGGGGVVVDPYPGSWRLTAPGSVPLFACP